ncbi:MAG: helix-turn-helix domain-containing protein [Candidatus Hodarchaeota archaeon]
MLDQIISLLQESFTVIDFSTKKGEVEILDASSGTTESVKVRLNTKSFDVLAKNKENCLIVKYVENIENFSKEKSLELLNIAKLLDATPLIMGNRNRNGLLEPNVVYNRYSVNVVNYTTLSNVLEYDQQPQIYSKRGGYFVQLKGEEFKEMRQNRNFSLQDIARKLEVTQKSIYEYEHDMKTRKVYVDALAELFEIAPDDFLARFVKDINIFATIYKAHDDIIRDLSGFHKEINNRLVELGFATRWFNRSPFDMMFQDPGAQPEVKREHSIVPHSKNVFISEISTVQQKVNKDLKELIIKEEKKIRAYITFLRKLKEVIDIKGNMVIVLDDNIFEEKEHIEGIPIIHKEEIPSENLEKLKKIIFQRKKL